MRGTAGQWQSPQERLMLFRAVGKLMRTMRSLPAAPAQLRVVTSVEPVFPATFIVASPSQGLALGAGCLVPCDIGGHQVHSTAQLCQDAHMPSLAAVCFCRCAQISHIGHNKRGTPVPLSMAIMEAWNEQSPFTHVGRSHPADRRHQLHAAAILMQPQPQRVLFVADKATALPGLERASAQCRMIGGALPGTFF